MQVVKPNHNKFILRNLDEGQYSRYAKRYSRCKRYGMRGIYCFLTGTGLIEVVKETSKGTVVQYGKRRLAGVVVSLSAYICAPAITVITNSTKIVKVCKRVHTTVSYVGEAGEDMSNLSFLPLDMLIFGQPIPIDKKGRFDLLGDSDPLEFFEL